MLLLYHTSSHLSILNTHKWYYFFIRGEDLRPLKEKVSVTIDSDVMESLRTLAEESARPLSQYINLVLRNHIRAVAKRREQQGSQEQE